MRELLVLSPLNIVLTTFIMVVVMGGFSFLELFSVVDLLCLREPGSGWLPPSVVEIKEHVVGMLELVSCGLELIELERNIGNFVKVSRSDLTDVEIDQVSIVSIDFK
jgi:hypothetical protein